MCSNSEPQTLRLEMYVGPLDRTTCGIVRYKNETSIYDNCSPDLPTEVPIVLDGLGAIEAWWD